MFIVILLRLKWCLIVTQPGHINGNISRAVAAVGGPATEFRIIRVPANSQQEADNAYQSKTITQT